MVGVGVGVVNGARVEGWRGEWRDVQAIIHLAGLNGWILSADTKKWSRPKWKAPPPSSCHPPTTTFKPLIRKLLPCPEDTDYMFQSSVIPSECGMFQK